MQTTDTRRSRKRAVERETFITEDGTNLTVAHFHVPGPEKGILLIPPLIGGSFLLFGRQFSFLVKQGYRVVSFNYRGHDKSGGLFTLSTSFSDTHEIARRLRDDNPDLPVVGVGTCSGSMPLFHILKKEPDLLNALILVNAIYHLQQTSTPINAVRLYLEDRGLRRPESIGDFVSVVLDRIFPEIEKGPDRFGIMSYDRLALWRLAWEYFFFRSPNRRFVCLKPTLCLYGLGDEMLNLGNAQMEAAYRKQLSVRFPAAEFKSFRADHFMTGIKEDIARTMQEFMDSRFRVHPSEIR